jgi:hypothetical protein
LTATPQNRVGKKARGIFRFQYQLPELNSGKSLRITPLQSADKRGIASASRLAASKLIGINSFRLV